MRRVVITGLGLVTPLGTGVEHVWKGILDGRSGIRPITAFDTEGYGCTIAGEVPSVDGRGGGEAGQPGVFDPDQVMSAKDRKRVDDFILYAIAAADEALADADWKPESEDDKEATGVMVGSGIGGLGPIADTAIVLKEQGVRRVSPFFIPSALINLASGQISIRHGLKGPNHSVVTACATGAHAIGDAARMIALGDADVMVAGGAESSVVPIGIAGFLACKALCTAYNDTPEKASRPYDRGHAGFVMGEGAGIMVLEEYEHAKARGAKIYAEVVGYGMSGDAYHITAPSEDGDGGLRAMKAALKRAGMQPSDLDYVNTHGTSTMADWIELKAVERLVGDHAKDLAVSSTKSMTGHLLGAAGAIESIFSVLAIRDQMAPPTINLDDPEMETPIDLIPHKGKAKKIDVAMSNSFGFGGTNAAVIFKKVD
ncbi:3-oxoacyl-[acyl-carrier-protein] synthase 2 [Brevundimonas diminuta]|jgi:3-oxoacyl-[acyl-carrier-protein] synthase II|uniref:3-oxoacyl-[acyl-carrier-protein] synthase 2 n=1 Tax=Brevundimonas diminuta TaxID=293 RepID=A0A246KM88_BREDI|nr:beta-ketoacyl-ACP synthase II [Brevundimonas diminuta]OJU54455.1 MAG: beta-ketoacyl-[acyl-carrier-protein] synthase II [Brevundimonas sp. 67-6]MBD3819294.1 beta-ketoacyl-ACP synthase II [Brevundimonas diminuta]MBI2251105.1 beta-ketoacyl-ACP synthase II [Brevundimonas diminuta]MCZ4107516.1 beta-ketoacyl-ACP synthase II [Brevundimonas diminuta]OWR24367.1 beta-ketoacyl-[acyl-carrier-protein] synthase II [Brevundimonas diminuta]